MASRSPSRAPELMIAPMSRPSTIPFACSTMPSMIASVSPTATNKLAAMQRCPAQPVNERTTPSTVTS